jgi:hypothetical protein
MAIKNSKIGPNGDQAIKSGTFFITATKKVVEPRKVDFFLVTFCYTMHISPLGEKMLLYLPHSRIDMLFV